MIKLTAEQRQELGQTHTSSCRVVDPVTNAEYVLVPADLYERLRALFEEVPISDKEEDALIHEAGMLAGWDDPEMDVYNNLDPRHQ